VSHHQGQGAAAKMISVQRLNPESWCHRSPQHNDLTQVTVLDGGGGGGGQCRVKKFRVNWVCVGM
jgi:hypothetical protein